MIILENKTGFSNTFAGCFSWGRPLLPQRAIGQFSRGIYLVVVGLGDFAGPESDGWPTGPISIEKSKLREVYETGGQFRAIHPVSIKKRKLGQLAIRWNFEPAKSANPTRFLSQIDQ